MWKVNATQEFDCWIENLDTKIKVKILSRLYLLKRFGPQLGRPYADSINGSRFSNLKELRISALNQEIRIFYVIDRNREILLLIGGNKSGNKRFYKTMIKTADNIYSNYFADEGE